MSGGPREFTLQSRQMVCDPSLPPPNPLDVTRTRHTTELKCALGCSSGILINAFSGWGVPRQTNTSCSMLCQGSLRFLVAY